MTYSVWNGALKRYDYYEDRLADKYGEAPSPNLPKKTVASTQAAWTLPADATPVGSGTVAKGRVATRGGSALGDFSLEGILTPQNIMLAVAAWYFL